MYHNELTQTFPVNSVTGYNERLLATQLTGDACSEFDGKSNRCCSFLTTLSETSAVTARRLNPQTTAKDSRIQICTFQIQVR
jgi:hypothetical protein